MREQLPRNTWTYSLHSSVVKQFAFLQIEISIFANIGIVYFGPQVCADMVQIVCRFEWRRRGGAVTTDKRRTSFLINRIRTPPVSYTEP